VGDPVTVPITTDEDIVGARRQGSALAADLGFGRGDQAVIAAAISEVARNILMYARPGQIELRAVPDGSCPGLAVVARDEGPGIRDVEQAMQDGFSTSGGLGLGLPGARRLMDEFNVVSEPGRGTTITMMKWLRNHG
jgi:serine/threonine-protein kinase RsbT